MLYHPQSKQLATELHITFEYAGEALFVLAGRGSSPDTGSQIVRMTHKLVYTTALAQLDRVMLKARALLCEWFFAQTASPSWCARGMSKRRGEHKRVCGVA